MRVIGIEGNMGSILHPFLNMGHEVVGNWDSRGIVNKKNFKANFPDAKLFEDFNEAISQPNIDVMISQPSCAKYSQLSRKDKDSYESCVNLKLAIESLKPKMFFIESKEGYINEFPEVEGYNYHFEWVGNYYYGNTQKSRDRLWVIGWRQDVPFKFIPYEHHHDKTVEKVLEGLPDHDIPEIDHVHKYKPFLKNSITKEYLSLDEAFDMLLEQGDLTYIAADGETKTRINRKMASPDLSRTITGGGTWFHWRKKYPLTIREKARIQGFDDKFSFEGLTETNKDKAVGKSIPSEFVYHLIRLAEGNFKGKPSKIIRVPMPIMLKNFRYNKLNKVLC